MNYKNLTENKIENGEILSAEDEKPLADDNLIESEQSQTIARAIATLPEKYRAPIVLRDVEGKTYEEIAADFAPRHWYN